MSTDSETPTTSYSAPQMSRPRAWLRQVVRATFAVSLLGAALTGIFLVLAQIVAAVAGDSALVTGLHTNLVPAACIMASVVCVASFISGYVDGRGPAEADD